MVRLLPFLLVLMPLAGHADSLNRCVSPSGAVSYQSAACASGQRLDRVVAYEPQADSAPMRLPRGKKQSAARAPARQTLARRATTRLTTADACACQPRRR